MEEGSISVRTIYCFRRRKFPIQVFWCNTLYFCFENDCAQITYFYVTKFPEAGLILVEACCPVI